MRDRGVPHLLLDVCRDEEYRFANMRGHLVLLHQLDERLAELESYRDTRVIVQCRSGARSARAAEYLRTHGFDAQPRRRYPCLESRHRFRNPDALT